MKILIDSRLPHSVEQRISSVLKMNNIITRINISQISREQCRNSIIVCYKHTVFEWLKKTSECAQILSIEDGEMSFEQKDESIENIFYAPSLNEISDKQLGELLKLLRLDSDIHQSSHLLEQLDLSLTKLTKGIPPNRKIDLDVKLIERLLEIEERVMSSINLKDARAQFIDGLNELIKGKVFKIDTSSAFEHFDKKQLLLPMGDALPMNILISPDISELSDNERILLFMTYNSFREYQNRFTQGSNEKIVSDSMLWENIWQHIQYPMALFSHNEIVKHNAGFVNLKILSKDCLKFKNRDKVTIEDKTYEVHINEFELPHQKLKLFCFKFNHLTDDFEVEPSSEELGIVSSSIAHELNNPLAGILAAVELLMMDKDDDEEIKNELMEIKSGAIRCKQLVETFLGFSRANPVRLKLQDTPKFSHHVSEGTSILVDAMERALNLIRFRLIENNIKLSHKFLVKNNFQGNINPSIFSMIFYLSLGDLVTFYSHYMLVAGHGSSSVLNLKLIETAKSFEIMITNDLRIDSSMLSSKLVGHLVDIENCDVQVNSNSIKFISREQLNL